MEKHEISESALRNLQKDLARIEHDLAVKTNSLALDNACMETRIKLVSSEELDAPEGDVDTLSKGIDNLPAMETTAGMTDGTTQDTPFKVKTSSQRVSFQEDVRDEVGQPYLKSTYDADFEVFKSKRSNDLQRTLGRNEENDTREVLFD